MRSVTESYSAGAMGMSGIDFHKRSEMTLQKRLTETEYEKATAVGKPPMQMLDGLR